MSFFVGCVSFCSIRFVFWQWAYKLAGLSWGHICIINFVLFFFDNAPTPHTPRPNCSPLAPLAFIIYFLCELPSNNNNNKIITQKKLHTHTCVAIPSTVSDSVAPKKVCFPFFVFFSCVSFFCRFFADDDEPFSLGFFLVFFLFNNETTFRTHKIVIIIFDIWSSTGRYSRANIKRILFKIKSSPYSSSLTNTTTETEAAPEEAQKWKRVASWSLGRVMLSAKALKCLIKSLKTKIISTLCPKTFWPKCMLNFFPLLIINNSWCNVLVN